MSERGKIMMRRMDRVCEIFYCSQLDTRGDLRELAAVTFGSGVSKTHRFAAGFQMAHCVGSRFGLEGVREKVLQRMCTGSDVPFTITPELIDCGEANCVFALRDEGGDAPYVLKTLKATRTIPFNELVRTACQMRDMNTKIEEMYAQDPPIVIPSSVLILRSPHRGVATIGVIQERIKEPIHDLFREYTSAQIVGQCGRDTRFRHSLSAFIDTTLVAWDDWGVAIDVVGHNNIGVVGLDDHQEGGRNWRLVLTDVFDLWARSDIESIHVKGRDGFYESFARLRELQGLLEYQEI